MHADRLPSRENTYLQVLSAHHEVAGMQTGDLTGALSALALSGNAGAWDTDRVGHRISVVPCVDLKFGLAKRTTVSDDVRK